MDVFITVDTEVWPSGVANWPRTPLGKDRFCKREIAAFLLGATRSGDYGVAFQCEELRRHGLTATFFVDPFFSFALGIDVLRHVVRTIEGAGHAVALHLHPEWTTDPRCPAIVEFRGPFMGAYSVEEQRRMIRAGFARLEEAGASPIRAFRAGSWGANLQTVEALRLEGIFVDSSLNSSYEHSFPDLDGRERMRGPTLVGGLCEYPVTRINDRVSRSGRHLSLVGSSSSEIDFALHACYERDDSNVVIVMHSNEFVATERFPEERKPASRKIALARFQRLCAFLSQNGDRFTTRALPQMMPLSSDMVPPADLVKSSLVRTGARIAAQSLSRFI